MLAHELTHVIQQTALGSPSASARGPPTATVRQRTGFLAVQCEEQGAFDQFAGAVVSFGEGAWETAAGVGEAAAELGADALSALVDEFAPGLLTFLRGGAAGQITDLFCSGLDLLVSSLLSPLEDLDLVTAVRDTFTSLTEGINGMWSGLGAGASAAVGAVMRPLVEALEVYGSPIIQGMSDAADSADGLFSSLWENVGVPVLDFLEAAGGAVWEGFTGMVDWIVEITEPLQVAAAEAWTWLCEQFDLAWESTKGIRDWLAETAAELWQEFLKTIEPIRTPLMAIGGAILLFSPLGPIIVLTQVIPPVYQKIVWLWNNWNTDEILVVAKDVLANDILPGIIGLVGSVGAAIAGAASWLASTVAGVVNAFATLLGLVSSNQCLTAVNRILNHVSDQFDQLAEWADNGFNGLGEAISAVFDALIALFQPILDFLVRLIIVAANPPMLPLAITAAVWLLCPDDLKPPVINFVLDFIIQFLRGLPTFLMGLGLLAPILKSAALGFLNTVRGKEDQLKIDASNKIANLMAGGGIEFIAGLAVGILEGLLDGILDPFRLIWMLIQFLARLVRSIGDYLAPLIFTANPTLETAVQTLNTTMQVPAPSAPAPTAAPAAAATPSPATAQPGSTVGPTATAPPATAASTGTLTRASAGGSPPASPAAATPTATSAAGPTPEDSAFADVLAGGPVPTDADVVGALSPGIAGQLTGAAGDLEAAQTEGETGAESEARSSGGTINGLADLLAGAWTAILEGASGLGGSIANALLGFIMLPDYQLGRKLGYVAGLVLLEVIIAYFSGGVSAQLKAAEPFIKAAIRFLDLGGEILGLLGRAVRPIKGPLLRGLSAAGEHLGRFRFLQPILQRIRRAADVLFHFGDEAAEAASHAPGRGTGLADDAARHADDAARHADDAARQADDAARHGDEVADDAAKAAQMPVAVAAARSICEANDRVHPSPPPAVVVAQLTAALRPRFRWIKTFGYHARGAGHYRIYFTASPEHYVDEDYSTDLDPETEMTGDLPAPRPRPDLDTPPSPHAPRRQTSQGVDITEDLGDSVNPSPGVAPRRGHTRADVGNFAHEFAEHLDEFADDIVPGRIPQGPNIRPEVPIRMRNGDVLRADRVDFQNGIVYEIKPAHGNWPARGRAQAQTYANRLDELQPLPNGQKWRVEVITYNLDELEAYLIRIGYFERSAAGPAPREVPASLPAALRRPGQPIPEPLRGRVESFFGADLRSVRLHTDELAARAAAESRAHAVTYENHIVLGAHRRDLRTVTARQTLVHEIAHTLQPPPGPTARGFAPDGAGSEREARQAAAAFAGGGRADRSARPTIARTAALHCEDQKPGTAEPPTAEPPTAAPSGEPAPAPDPASAPAATPDQSTGEPVVGHYEFELVEEEDPSYKWINYAEAVQKNRHWFDLLGLAGVNPFHPYEPYATPIAFANRVARWQLAADKAKFAELVFAAEGQATQDSAAAIAEGVAAADAKASRGEKLNLGRPLNADGVLGPRTLWAMMAAAALAADTNNRKILEKNGIDVTSLGSLFDDETAAWGASWRAVHGYLFTPPKFQASWDVLRQSDVVFETFEKNVGLGDASRAFLDNLFFPEGQPEGAVVENEDYLAILARGYGDQALDGIVALFEVDRQYFHNVDIQRLLQAKRPEWKKVLDLRMGFADWDSAKDLLYDLSLAVPTDEKAQAAYEKLQTQGTNALGQLKTPTDKLAVLSVVFALPDREPGFWPKVAEAYLAEKKALEDSMTQATDEFLGDLQTKFQERMNGTPDIGKNDAMAFLELLVGPTFMSAQNAALDFQTKDAARYDVKIIGKKHESTSSGKATALLERATEQGFLVVQLGDKSDSRFPLPLSQIEASRKAGTRNGKKPLGFDIIDTPHAAMHTYLPTRFTARGDGDGGSDVVTSPWEVTRDSRLGEVARWWEDWASFQPLKFGTFDPVLVEIREFNPDAGQLVRLWRQTGGTDKVVLRYVWTLGSSMPELSKNLWKAQDTVNLFGWIDAVLTIGALASLVAAPMIAATEAGTSTAAAELGQAAINAAVRKALVSALKKFIVQEAIGEGLGRLTYHINDDPDVPEGLKKAWNGLMVAVLIYGVGKTVQQGVKAFKNRGSVKFRQQLAQLEEQLEAETRAGRTTSAAEEAAEADIRRRTREKFEASKGDAAGPSAGPGRVRTDDPRAADAVKEQRGPLSATHKLGTILGEDTARSLREKLTPDALHRLASIADDAVIKRLLELFPPEALQKILLAVSPETLARLGKNTDAATMKTLLEAFAGSAGGVDLLRAFSGTPATLATLLKDIGAKRMIALGTDPGADKLFRLAARVDPAAIIDTLKNIHSRADTQLARFRQLIADVGPEMAAQIMNTYTGREIGQRWRRKGALNSAQNVARLAIQRGGEPTKARAASTIPVIPLPARSTHHVAGDFRLFYAVGSEATLPALIRRLVAQVQEASARAANRLNELLERASAGTLTDADLQALPPGARATVEAFMRAGPDDANRAALYGSALQYLAEAELRAMFGGSLPPGVALRRVEVRRGKTLIPDAQLELTLKSDLKDPKNASERAVIDWTTAGEAGKITKYVGGKPPVTYAVEIIQPGPPAPLPPAPKAPLIVTPPGPDTTPDTEVDLDPTTP